MRKNVTRYTRKECLEDGTKRERKIGVYAPGISNKTEKKAVTGKSTVYAK